MQYIDIFAGCGGLSLGLYNAGLHGIFAIEKNQDAFNTLRTNLIDNKNHFSWVDWLNKSPHDIDELLEKNKSELISMQGKVDLVAGGPPCQGFSMAGQRKHDDSRNHLVYSYIKFINYIRPEFIFFENVRGITQKFRENDLSIKYSDKIVDELKSLGYKLSSKIIDMSEYGIPQARKRFILIGSLNNSPDKVFEILEKNKEYFLQSYSLNNYITVEEAIGDLLCSNHNEPCPDYPTYNSSVYGEISSSYQAFMRRDINKDENIANSHRFAKHTEKIIELHNKILEKNIRSKRITPKDNIIDGLLRRGVTLLDKDGIAPTVTSHPDDMVHYKEPRILTVRECARLQSFPDWYKFTGKYTTGGQLRKKDVPRYTQVGNAIPPLFAEQIGLAFLEVIKGEKYE